MKKRWSKLKSKLVVTRVVKLVVKRVVKISGQKGQWLLAGQPAPAVPYLGRWTESMVKKGPLTK